MLFEQETLIADWGQKRERNIVIDLVSTKDERSEAFQDFCNHLARIVPEIRIKTETEDEFTLPGIRIENIFYQAIPVDKELELFLNRLADSAFFARQLPVTVRGLLNRLGLPAPLKIYITPHCPFCPVTVKQLLCVAAASKFIKLTLIDGTLFPELANLDNIRSAPTVLLDDQYRWTGSIQIQEVVEMILNRDPSRLSATSLEDMLKDGEAVRVAEMMTASGKIFPALLDLMVHEKWPVRLGAMVAFETMAAHNQELAAQFVPLLWERFFQVKDVVKGDILYLLGQSGDGGAIAKLESILIGPYSDDVREAAADALEEIRCRSLK